MKHIEYASKLLFIYIILFILNVIFRFGKTFGADTKDAKRWLRADFSPI